MKMMLDAMDVRAKGKSVVPDPGAIGKDIGALSAAIGSPVGSIFDAAIKSIGKKQETKYKQQLQSKQIPKEEQIALNLSYKKIFEDLISQDEILSEKDPTELANYYKAMINMSPHIAAEPEIVRAHLRAMSTQAAMSPYDAKLLAELEDYYR